ncbi:MAG: hypothetical protein JWN38_227 [Candidatus Saccharibacteria bacterium]|nr:hypothetical protein [Candidatus Saccharibacteria bacterium]
MAYKKPDRSAPSGKSGPKGLRPGQDFFAGSSKPKSVFPDVGMSLPLYPKKAAPAARPRRRVTSGPATLGEPLPPPRRAALDPTKKGADNKDKKPRNIKQKVKRTLLALLVVLLIGGGWLGGKFVYNLIKVSNGNILSILKTTKLKGEDKGRVTILLAGNSADDVGHNGAELTDSIILLSIDTVNNQAYMLSVPRDLYVGIGDDYAKINSAYVVGKANNFSERGYPKGGMGQLEQIVADNFGVDINYYALVNYNAFREAVNAVGGIDITVNSQDPRGLYDPNIDYTTGKALVNLTNGKHHLDGQAALDLARARGDSYRSYGFAGSDFDRTTNQRTMLLALKSKAVTAGVLANPAKLSSLADAIGSNVSTDMNLGEIRRLYDLTKDLGNSKIASISLNNVNGKDLLTNYVGAGGQSALVPAAGIDDYSDIQAAIKQATSSDPVVREAPSIVVLNGTDTMGLASIVRSKLTAKNYNVLAIGDADAKQTKTQVIDVTAGAKPGSKAALGKLFNTTPTTINPYKGEYNADFIIVAGNDQIPKPATMPSTSTGN